MLVTQLEMVPVVRHQGAFLGDGKGQLLIVVQA